MLAGRDGLRNVGMWSSNESTRNTGRLTAQSASETPLPSLREQPRPGARDLGVRGGCLLLLLHLGALLVHALAADVGDEARQHQRHEQLRAEPARSEVRGRAPQNKRGDVVLGLNNHRPASPLTR